MKPAGTPSTRSASPEEIRAAAREGHGGLVQLVKRARREDLRDAGLEVTA